LRTFAQRGGAGVISLQHGDGAVLWECDGATSLFTNIGGISIRSTPAGLIFLCWDDDPHFDLVLPSDVLARLQSNACLVVELTPSALLEACAKVLRQDERLMADFRGAANAGGAAQSCVPDLSTDIEMLPLCSRESCPGAIKPSPNNPFSLPQCGMNCCAPKRSWNCLMTCGWPMSKSARE
jgi:hypothetical protein